MSVRAMRGPYALWRALAELNVLASFRLRKVISTLVSVYITYQVTFYLYMGAENKRNTTRKRVDRWTGPDATVQEVERIRSGSWETNRTEGDLRHRFWSIQRRQDSASAGPMEFPP